jgi:DNA-binding transcriptional ArsR family regulator
VQQDEYRISPMKAADLRALAHPLRLQLLELLRAEGPSTASQLGRRLGESSGSTSYHLRALHRAGMIEEDEQRNGRERWWRRVPGRTLVPNSLDPAVEGRERTDLQAAHAKIESVLVQRDEDALEQWQAVRYTLPLDWQDATYIGNLRIWATADELRGLMATLLAAAERYRRAPEDRPDGAREVHVTLRLLAQKG